MKVRARSKSTSGLLGSLGCVCISPYTVLATADVAATAEPDFGTWQCKSNGTMQIMDKMSEVPRSQDLLCVSAGQGKVQVLLPSTCLEIMG